VTAAAASWSPPAWTPTGQRQSVVANDAVATAMARFREAATDPRVLTGGVLAGLVFALALRDPLTHALGTAGPTVPEVTSSQELPAPVTGTYVALPRQVPQADAPRAHVARDPFAPRAADTSRAATTATAAAPVPVSASAPSTGSPTATTVKTYRIKSGDSLWSIAAHSLGTSAGNGRVASAWKSIYAANRAALGPDPSQVASGIVLRLPQSVVGR
jgi:nucleoid-associated protein YgaU